MCVSSSSRTEDSSFALATESPCAPFQPVPVSSSFHQAGPDSPKPVSRTRVTKERMESLSLSRWWGWGWGDNRQFQHLWALWGPDTVLGITFLCGHIVDGQPDLPGSNKCILRTCNLRSRDYYIPILQMRKLRLRGVCPSPCD